MPIVHDDADLRAILGDARSVAVVGGHPDASRPSHYAPAYLAERGYRVVAVNPGYVGRELFGASVVATLGDVPGPIDMVLFFRPGDALPAYVPEVLAMAPRPRYAWFQLHIRNDAAAGALSAEGLTVVQDQCAYATHKRLGM